MVSHNPDQITVVRSLKSFNALTYFTPPGCTGLFQSKMVKIWRCSRRLQINDEPFGRVASPIRKVDLMHL